MTKIKVGEEVVLGEELFTIKGFNKETGKWIIQSTTNPLDVGEESEERILGWKYQEPNND